MPDFLESLAAAITVRQLATPLAHALAFSPATPQSVARLSLSEQQFDFGPVIDGDQVVGCIARADLDGDSDEPLMTLITPLHERIIVSADSPIDLIVKWFRKQPFLLMLEGRDVIGLVTVSDLNKQAARTYLYALVAGFEMALANLLRMTVEDQRSILEFCSESRRDAILEDYSAAGNQEADYIAAMNLPDLLKVTGAIGLAADLGFESRTSWRNETGSLVKFRNQVAHPTKPIVSANGDIDRVGRAIDSLQKLYEAARRAGTRHDQVDGELGVRSPDYLITN